MQTCDGDGDDALCRAVFCVQEKERVGLLENSRKELSSM